MSRKSRRLRRALVLLNLMVAGYNLAAAWALHGATAHPMIAVPQALLASALAVALMKWSPPRAPRLALRTGVFLQAVVWAAAIAGTPGLQVVVVSLYAAVAMWLANRTFLAGEPTALH